ncbi:alpha-1,3-mannosyl-glycoprotein 4-beta-N-acetylglucosaminyltransferase B-like [Lampris incognitus]|uniref:alpha-1,3-mannosyl-glycoprotein 4-beta-N-acetylglucosaminyltransferase B-like n=1 Tax=Lampris incognitus TaxID=2546036 RepID=UPI0024B49085|nr:alpha-1,3-mannosyl-glycoprotein 4-beta-N-acetylglucosaminyltransferase B-like [Lampris incognitus]
MRLRVIKLGCLLALGCFLSLTWISSMSNDGAQADMQSLLGHLQMTELLGESITRDLNRLLEQLKNLSRAQNATYPTTVTNILAEGIKNASANSEPRTLNSHSMHLFLPHLGQHPDSLIPNVVLGQGRRGVSLVLGVSTVKRQKQSYLVNTLNSLVYTLTPSQCRDLLIIVFVAESDREYVDTIAETIRKNFPREVMSGMLEVVSPSRYYYPNFTSLKETFGDSKERVKWRTKQNLDYSYLMVYAQDKGTYYVQLEDDIVAKADYYIAMKNYVTQHASNQWLFLEFSQLGFIGKMFHTHDLPLITEFFLMFHRDKPIDWLLDHILWVKVCNPEKTAKDCDKQKSLLKQRHKPSLFQHVGLHSSLSGKLQHLKDKDFGKESLYHPHSNPTAEVSSSLKHYKQHTLERAYRGEDFFWGLTPIQGDYVLFHFTSPTYVKGYLFRSGNMETSGDRFYNTTVEVLPSDASVRENLSAGSSAQYKGSSDGFLIVGAFEHGVAEGEVEAAVQPVSALRLMVQSDSDVWVLLSEIFIKV